MWDTSTGCRPHVPQPSRYWTLTPSDSHGVRPHPARLPAELPPACLGPADCSPALPGPRATAHRLTSRGKPRYVAACRAVGTGLAASWLHRGLGLGPCQPMLPPQCALLEPPLLQEGAAVGEGLGFGDRITGKPPPVSTPQRTLVLGWVLQFHLRLTRSPGVMGTGFGRWEWGWRDFWGMLGQHWLRRWN